MPSEARGEGGFQLWNAQQQLPVLGPYSKPGSRQKQENQLVGKVAMTSPWGPEFLLAPGELSEEGPGLWELASVWVVS